MSEYGATALIFTLPLTVLAAIAAALILTRND